MTVIASQPRLDVFDTSVQAAEAAAELIAERARANPELVLGVATGSTPEPLYRSLAALRAAGAVDLSRARAFALDEYVGLPAGHPASYRRVVDTQVTEPLRLDPARVAVPDGTHPDPAQAAAEYERAIREAGGIDLQILGIGANGHIAFNEPGSAFDSRTRQIELTPRTRADNARFFGGVIEEVPRTALSQGIGTILEAREIVLLAFGEGKADAVAQALTGEIGTACPASALRAHPATTILLDAAAAGRL